MKRLILFFSIFLLPALTSQVKVYAATESTLQKYLYIEAQTSNLGDRLKKLRSLDGSNMIIPERKELRKEIRYTAHQLKEPGGGGGILVSLIPLVVAVVLIILFI